MSGSSIATLAEGRLYALQNAYELDGRVSSYPENARGFTAANCYLLKEDDGALLLDTGFATHEGAVMDQLGELLDDDTPLYLFPLRLNEFMSVCNAMPIAELDVAVIAPTHGLPILDLAATGPKVREGLLAGSDLVLSQEALVAAVHEKSPVH